LTLPLSAADTVWLVDRAALHGAALALVVSELVQVVILGLITLADQRANPPPQDRIGLLG
jgi:hypothetical protein